MIERLAKIFLVAAFVITISSCEKQSCKNVVCPIGQNCNSGQCYCPDGYEGTDCQTMSYTKYLNLNNSAFESCTPSNTPFFTSSVFILWNGSYAYQIQINGLMGGNCFDIGAYIRTDNNNKGNIIEIPEQTCGGSSIYGQGTFNELNGTLNLQLYYNVNGITYQCTTTLQ
jgi:hypothetical protein